MTVYRCKFCNRKYFSADMLICEECFRNEFLQENLNMAPPESTLPPMPETMNSRSKPNHPIGEVNVQVLSDSPSQREQREPQKENMIFSHKDSTVNECHVNNDSEASNFFYQHISQKVDELSESFSQNKTAMDTLSPDIENPWDQIRTSHLTASECHRNEDAKASNFSSQHMSMELEHFRKYQTALNILSPEIEKTFGETEHSSLAAIECYRKDAEKPNLGSQQIISEQEPLLNHISEPGAEINTSFQIIRDLLCETQSSLALGNDAETRSNFNYAAESTSSGESPQNLMNYYDTQSICNRENHRSIEMITEIIESLQIKSQDSQLYFPVSSASTSGVSKFVPESVVIHRNAGGIQTKTSSCFPGLCNNSANSTENFSLQQDAHSSESETMMEGVEKFSVLRALLLEPFASPTPKTDFECDICNRKFTDELLFAIHRQTHERRLPFKCDQCHKEFKFESGLRQHYVTRVEKWPFNCRYCAYAFKWKSQLNEHIRHRHKSQLSSQRLTSDRKWKWKCEKCSKRFKKESKFHFHVRNNCDSNPFKCDQCSEEFSSEIKLQRHYRVHTEENFFSMRSVSLRLLTKGKSRNP